jgi:acetolactate synthase I/III small subunit
MRRIISILLQNEAGALSRVAGMFSARGYNIESLTVAATHDVAISRLTLVTFGDEIVIDQIIKQSRKLVDVLEITDLTSQPHLEAELLLVKVALDPLATDTLDACLYRHRAAGLHETEATRTIQLAGTGAQIDAFLAEIGGIGQVLELARSGTAALGKGGAPAG